MVHGSNQPCTWRRASGHDSRGRAGTSGATGAGSRGGERGAWPHGQHLVAPLIIPSGARAPEVRPPTEGEGAADQLPMPPDGAVRADLEVCPTQGALDLLIPLFHPLA